MFFGGSNDWKGHNFHLSSSTGLNTYQYMPKPALQEHSRVSSAFQSNSVGKKLKNSSREQVGSYGL